MSDIAISFIVLFTAIGHSLWNAFLKKSGDPFLMAVGIYLTGFVFGAVAALVSPIPAPECWPFLVITAVANVASNMLLANAYRFGDLSQIYPIARGSSPLIVVAFSMIFIDEDPGPWRLAGIVLISIGIMVLAAGASGRFRGRPVAMAVATGLLIGVYSFFGGVGVRAAHTALGFAGWLHILTGTGMVLGGVGLRGPGFLHRDPLIVLRGAAAGIVAIGGFAISLWAMTRLSLGAVTALRETSAVFGTLIGIAAFHEECGRRRLLAACMVSTGIAIVGFSIA
ncbi:MAG: EamA family transporter [Telmatospirillum sp.]|nr:EamA family transporter [Telmatospirillum sp.]